MGKIKNNHKFGTAPNTLLNNKDISLKAKGLYAFMDSKPETWDFSIKGISSQIKEQYEAIKTALDELVNAGYLTRHNYKNALGQWDCDYELFPNGNAIKQTKTGSSRIGFPVTGNSATDKFRDGKTPHLSNKEISKKEISKKEEVEDTATAIINKLIRLIPELENAPQLHPIVKRLRDMDNWEAYVEYVATNKRDRWYDLNGWDKWFYKDYLSQPPESRIEYDPEIQAIIDRAMSRA